MRESVLFDEDPAVLVRPPVESLSGELHGMDLPAFLQLLEIERKTCTVLVRHEARAGTLVFDRGALIHARRGELAGDAAALDMFCWEQPHIVLREATALPRNVVTRLSQLLLEAFRLFDERTMSALTGHAPPSGDEPGDERAGDEPPAPPCTAEDLVDLAPGLVHGFVVGRPDGRIVLAAGAPFVGDARGFARAVARAHDAACAASAPAALAEMVVIAGARATLIWRSVRSPELSIVLVMKRNSAACALAARRLRLRGW